MIRNKSISESRKSRFTLCAWVFEVSFLFLGKGKEVLEVVMAVEVRCPRAEVNNSRSVSGRAGDGVGQRPREGDSESQ